jgi:hypothetical protein
MSALAMARSVRRRTTRTVAPHYVWNVNPRRRGRDQREYEYDAPLEWKVETRRLEHDLRHPTTLAPLSETLGALAALAGDTGRSESAAWRALPPPGAPAAAARSGSARPTGGSAAAMDGNPIREGQGTR